jgi:hypothetical protein
MVVDSLAMLNAALQLKKTGAAIVLVLFVAMLSKIFLAGPNLGLRSIANN